jgi:hypothetical protein
VTSTRCWRGAARERRAAAAEGDRRDLPLVGDGAARRLARRADALQPEGTVGIRRATRLKLAYLQGYLSSSWDPPNPTHLETLAQARRQVAAAIEGVNRFFAERVDPYRAEVEAGGPRLLPALAPLPVP